MAFRIGFTASQANETSSAAANAGKTEPAAPRKSLVQIRFPSRGMTLSYYNDQFDLRVGDRVYVDGKLEGQIGTVTAVNYSFKIRLSDYKRVIARVSTEVHGRFVMGGSHFISFDRRALPREQVARWFRAPIPASEIFESGSDESGAFPLDDLRRMGVDDGIAERGHDYYLDNRVRYLSLDGDRGYALVEGREAYEVEFTYQNGEIRDLVCSCFCACKCKHAFAAMLQLKETLEGIERHYADEFAASGYFAAILKGTLFTYAINGKETGSFTL